MFIQKKSKKVTANEDIMDQNVDPAVDDMPVDDGGADVVVEPEATDLLFEAEDVAELVAEITGLPVDVSVEDDSVEFAVGEDVYTVEAEGDEEVLEAASRKAVRSKSRVAASTNRRPADRASRPVRKMPSNSRAARK